MAKTDTNGASTAGSGGDTPGTTSGKATPGKAGSRKAGTKKASPKAAPKTTTSAKTTAKAGKNGKNGKKAEATPTTSITTGPGDVTAEVTTPEPVVPAARTAPESRPLAVRHPRKPAPAPRHSEGTAEVATTDVTAGATDPEPVGGEVARPASSSTVDELSRLAMVPVDVARRVLPERRLPFYLGVGALAVVGVVEWPLAVGASLAWEALRRRPAR